MTPSRMMSDRGGCLGLNPGAGGGCCGYCVCRRTGKMGWAETLSRLCRDQVRVKDWCTLDETTNRRQRKVSMTVTKAEPLNGDSSRWTLANCPRY